MEEVLPCLAVPVGDGDFFLLLLLNFPLTLLSDFSSDLLLCGGWWWEWGSLTAGVTVMEGGRDPARRILG